jgi:hypothetical protein
MKMMMTNSFSIKPPAHPSALPRIFELYGDRLQALADEERTHILIATSMALEIPWPEVLWLRFKENLIPDAAINLLLGLTDKEKLNLICVVACILRTNGNAIAIHPSTQ